MRLQEQYTRTLARAYVCVSVCFEREACNMNAPENELETAYNFWNMLS
jgi:hypothetical protein